MITEFCISELWVIRKKTSWVGGDGVKRQGYALFTGQLKSNGKESTKNSSFCTWQLEGCNLVYTPACYTTQAGAIEVMDTLKQSQDLLVQKIIPIV